MKSRKGRAERERGPRLAEIGSRNPGTSETIFAVGGIGLKAGRFPPPLTPQVRGGPETRRGASQEELSERGAFRRTGWENDVAVARTTRRRLEKSGYERKAAGAVWVGRIGRRGAGIRRGGGAHEQLAARGRVSTSGRRERR